jgi:NDP-sugar pyrophosphorylase family protein
MLCAGEGTRCYPFTHLSPKVAQEVCGIPIIEYMLSWFGGTPEIDKLYIVVKQDYIVDVLNDYIQKRAPLLENVLDLFSRLGYKVEYTNPNLKIEVLRANGWGTGGDLRCAIRHVAGTDGLDDHFLFCNGDYVTLRRLPDDNLTTQLNVSDIINYHGNAQKATNTVMTASFFPVEREDAVRFGVAEIRDIEGYDIVRDFREKPPLEDIPDKPWINAGIYLLDTNFILSNIDEYLPDQPNTSLERTLLERLAKAEEPRLAAYLLDLYAWFDVGTLNQLVDTSVYVANRQGGYFSSANPSAPKCQS